jgi:hypothetical protein
MALARTELRARATPVRPFAGSWGLLAVGCKRKGMAAGAGTGQIGRLGWKLEDPGMGMPGAQRVRVGKLGESRDG